MQSEQSYGCVGGCLQARRLQQTVRSESSAPHWLALSFPRKFGIRREEPTLLKPGSANRTLQCSCSWGMSESGVSRGSDQGERYDHVLIRTGPAADPLIFADAVQRSSAVQDCWNSDRG